MDIQERQQILDQEHLKLLRIGYFVMGGLAAFGAAMGVLYGMIGLVAGVAAASMPHQASEPPPAFFGCLFGGIGCFILIFSGTYMVLALLTAFGSVAGFLYKGSSISVQ